MKIGHFLNHLKILEEPELYNSKFLTLTPVGNLHIIQTLTLLEQSLRQYQDIFYLFFLKSHGSLNGNYNLCYDVTIDF